MDATRLYQNITQLLRLTVEGSFLSQEASASLRALIARAARTATFEEIEGKLTAAEADVRMLFARLIGGA